MQIAIITNTSWPIHLKIRVSLIGVYYVFLNMNKTYKSCTKTDDEAFWCATSVNADLDWQAWGYCNELCPLEGTVQVL